MDYVVLFSIIFLSVAASLIGTVSVIKQESLIGDAIGHSAYPGIIAMFLLIAQKNIVALSFGAVLSSVLAYLAIAYLFKMSKLKGETLMAIVLSSFFGFGVLISRFALNRAINKGEAKGLNEYVFGTAATVLKSEMYLLLTIMLIVIFLSLIFRNRVKVYLFDPIFAKVSGQNTFVTNFVLTALAIITIVLGVRVVGVILISSMLFISPVTAMQFSKKYTHVQILSALFSIITSIVGVYISYLWNLSPGSTVIVVSVITAFISILIGPYGSLVYYIRKIKEKRKKEIVNE